MNNDALVGQTFGTFKVIERAAQAKNGNRLYKCECIECGSLLYRRRRVILNPHNRCPVCAERRRSPQFEPFEDCFGYENGECTALVELVCAHKGWCAFYDRRRDDG